MVVELYVNCLNGKCIRVKSTKHVLGFFSMNCHNHSNYCQVKFETVNSVHDCYSDKRRAHYIIRESLECRFWCCCCLWVFHSIYSICLNCIYVRHLLSILVFVNAERLQLEKFGKGKRKFGGSKILWKQHFSLHNRLWIHLHIVSFLAIALLSLENAMTIFYCDSTSEKKTAPSTFFRL